MTVDHSGVVSAFNVSIPRCKACVPSKVLTNVGDGGGLVIDIWLTR
jgi:hypothetical protein